MNPPKIAYIIGALALIWFIVRLYTRRIEERRQAERDERMAKLFEEREEIMRKRHEEGPHSLGGVVSDSDPPRKSAVPDSQQPAEHVKVRCKACRALNDESATECSSCGEKI